MIRRHIIILLALLPLSLPLSAQYEGTTWEQRLGHGADSTRNYELFREYNDYFTAYDAFRSTEVWPTDSVYRCWRQLFDGAPYCHKILYSGGSTLLDSMIVRETDPAVRLLYFQDLMQLMDARAARIDALNSYEQEQFRSTLGDVLSRKASDYYLYAPLVTGSGYTPQRCYDLFVQAFDNVREQGGKEIEGYYLTQYFQACYALYQEDNERYLEQFLQDYLTCTDICDRMIRMSREVSDSAQAMGIVNRYLAPEIEIQQLFKASGAGTRDNIVAYYDARLQSHRDDIPFLQSAVHLLFLNGCSDTDVYYDACDALWSHRHTYEAAIGQALFSKSMNMREEMLNYFNEAKQLASTDIERGLVSYLIGTSLDYYEDLNKYATNAEKITARDRWWQDLRGADINYREALQYNPDIAGNCYFHLTTVNIYLQNYDRALEYARLAPKADLKWAEWSAGIQGTIAERRARKAEADARARAASTKSEEYRRWEAQYKKQLEQQRREEEFWRGGGRR